MKAYSYIRFSSLEQMKGDSLRRQLEASEVYAKAHGLTLDDSLRLTDRGLSAFHGVHRTKGALSVFLRLVEQGEVEPGSVLLVESLDRLSREQVLDALSQFTGIIGAGIKVVTLADRMEYDRDSINSNFGQLLMSLVIMSRAHEESALKAMRLGAAWGQKRKDAAGNGHKLTAKCPAWLRLSEDKKTFKILPEVAQVVNLIFQMKLAGKGSETIVRTLNTEKSIWKPVSKRNPVGGWRKSYIEKILRTRAVLGEYQPHKKIEGKRVPEGEVIQGYFPPIVDDELFNRVQAGIQNNREISGNAGGKTGVVNNLFGYIARCGYCGAPMAHVNKGQPPKGGSYLVCDNARRGLGCKKLYIRYDRFEPLVLTYCKGLDPREILPGNEKIQSELSVLRNSLQAVEGELSQVDGNIIHLLDNLELGDLVKDRLKARQEQKAQLETQRKALTRQIAKIDSIGKDAAKQLRDVQELIDIMTELEGQERIDLRLNLRNQLRRLIRQINVYPDRVQIGLLFSTGERRLLTVLKGHVKLLDIAPKAFKIPAQLWPKPWKRFYKPIKR
jgi:DNA invertase Pin-like site-specific DNA recombinase